MFSMGIDFGTESGRVLIIDKNGIILSTSVINYKHGVITEKLPIKENYLLPEDFALQHPKDYLEVLEKGIPKALDNANITSEKISGVGVAFTSSTMLATDSNLTPMCLYKQFKKSFHAWPKLWKHHGAQKETEEIYNIAIKRKEEWLGSYGDNVSTEWFLPKCLETFYKDSELYFKTDLFIEAGDWIVSILTGKVVRSNCSLGFKAFWNEKDDFPIDFMEALHPEFGKSMLSKLKGEIKNVGKRAGLLTKEMAEKTGLLKGTPIAVSVIDAHSSNFGIGDCKEKQLTIVMGTSTCHLMLNENYKHVSGISGTAKNATIPWLYTYEAGQSAVGDLFAWYSKQIPYSYWKEAEQNNI